MLISELISWWAKGHHWRLGKLANDTLVMTAGMGTRALLQAAVFLIIARVLGVAEYGKFAAVLALSSALSGFVGFGTQTLVVRNVARVESNFAESWGRVLYTLAISIPLALCSYFILASVTLPTTIPFAVVVLIGFAEIGFAPIATVSMIAFQSHEAMRRASQLLIIPVAAKLSAAAVLLLVGPTMPHDQILLSWALFYALANLATAGYCATVVHRDLGQPTRPLWRTLGTSIREGLPFSINGAALRFYADIDKTMLARLSTLSAAGAYSAGYRIMDMASVPFNAFFASALPRFFRAGGGGLDHAIGNAMRMLPFPIIYAVCAGLGLSLFSDLLPLVLGPGYSESTAVLRWLAWLPLISLLRIFLQTVLLSSGYQNSLVTVTVFGALTNITLNFWFINSWGWRGAAAATYLAESLMFLLMLGVLFLQYNNNRPKIRPTTQGQRTYNENSTSTPKS